MRALKDKIEREHETPSLCVNHKFTLCSPASSSGCSVFTGGDGTRFGGVCMDCWCENTFCIVPESCVMFPLIKYVGGDTVTGGLDDDNKETLLNAQFSWVKMWLWYRNKWVYLVQLVWEMFKWCEAASEEKLTAYIQEEDTRWFSKTLWPCGLSSPYSVSEPTVEKKPFWHLWLCSLFHSQSFDSRSLIKKIWFMPSYNKTLQLLL